ncbi:Heat shock protein 16 [Leucoagaricus sp. SymC.cos]|nr:Heat shock protein 16 [Leucoagaricus sp. SymC.cos]
MSTVFYEPFYNFDRFFEHAFSPFAHATITSQQLERRNAIVLRTFKPRMDLHEDSEKNVVSATFELPGVKKDDVRLEVQDGFLTVSAETKSSTEHGESGYAVRERRFGNFSRTLRLPKGVKDEEIKAAMADGVLTITFSRISLDQESKKITIA